MFLMLQGPSTRVWQARRNVAGSLARSLFSAACTTRVGRLQRETHVTCSNAKRSRRLYEQGGGTEWKVEGQSGKEGMEEKGKRDGETARLRGQLVPCGPKPCHSRARPCRCRTGHHHCSSTACLGNSVHASVSLVTISPNYVPSSKHRDPGILDQHRAIYRTKGEDPARKRTLHGVVHIDTGVLHAGTQHLVPGVDTRG